MKVTLLSLPQSTATPFQTGSSSAPSPATILIGNGVWDAIREFRERVVDEILSAVVIHPVGNIAEHLVAAGFARVVDWHAGMLASSGGMERLRAAERVAKEKRLCLYANLPTPSTSKANGYAGGNSRNFDGTVTRVWSGDQLSIIDKEGKERRVYLSSTRAPKCVVYLSLFYRFSDLSLFQTIRSQAGSLRERSQGVPEEETHRETCQGHNRFHPTQGRRI